MATLAEIARQRKGQLKQLMLASRKLDAAQETLEREVKRLLNRRRAIPEIADVQRLVTLARGVDAGLTSMGTVLNNLAKSWSYT